MTPTPSTTREASDDIGKLCLGGDAACENGDLAGLRNVVQQLADFVPEPMHCELDALAAACNADADRAVALWAALKNRLYREVRA